MYEYSPSPPLNILGGMPEDVELGASDIMVMPVEGHFNSATLEFGIECVGGAIGYVILCRKHRWNADL